MRATFLKEYLETLSRANISSPQAWAISTLIDLMGELYSHSAEIEKLYTLQTSIAKSLEERSQCTLGELEDLLKPFLEIALEKIADAYSQGFKDAVENSLEIAELTI